MAARNQKPTDSTETTAGQVDTTSTSADGQTSSMPAATVSTRQYDAGDGWDVGQRAPADAYRALDDQGTGAPTGPVLDHHPGGYARLIVQKGATVTEAVRRELDAAEQSETRED